MARDTVPNRQPTLEERTFFEALLGLRAAYGRRGSADAEGRDLDLYRPRVRERRFGADGIVSARAPDDLGTGYGHPA